MINILKQVSLKKINFGISVLKNADKKNVGNCKSQTINPTLIEIHASQNNTIYISFRKIYFN